MSKVITLENLEVFKQECDKVYASKEEIITATVDCSHKYEITGNTGDEHGLAIDDQQMLIKKIQGHSRRKSLNLLKIDKNNFTLEENTYKQTFKLKPNTNYTVSTNLEKESSGQTRVWFNGTSTINDGVWNGNNKTKMSSSNGELYLLIETSSFAQLENKTSWIMFNEGTTALPFKPYDNTLVNSNNTLISTGRNLININEYAKGRTKQGQTTNVTDYPKLTCSSTGDARLGNFKSADYYLSLPKGQYKLVIDNLTRVENYSLCNVFLPNNIIVGSSPLSVGKNVINLNLETDNTIGIMSKTPNSSFNIGLFFKDENNEYEYKQDTITTIGSLGEFDYILPQSNQKVIQTSQVVTLNGSENWIIEEISPTKRFLLERPGQNGFDDTNSVNIINNAGLQNASANHTWSTKDASMSVKGNHVHLLIEGITTLDALKQYLRSNPIQLVYKLATPTIENYTMPSGMAVYNGGLQIQQGDVPYTITKQYNLSQKAQILANIEVDREQQKQIDENNQKFNLIPKFSHVDITLPETSMNGTLTEEEFKILQANDLNYIMFNKEIYMLSDKTHTIDTLTYSHVGYENHKHMLKTISVTVSTRAWVLNTTEIMTGNSGSDTQSLLGVWVLNETINHNISSYKSFIMTFNSNGIRTVDFRLIGDNKILYEQYPIGGTSKNVEVYNPTNKWNAKTPSYRTIQITDISGLNTEEKTALATFLRTNAVKAQDFITINQPGTATNGTLDTNQLSTLQANDLNYIIFNNEIYSLNDKTHTADTLTYSHVGFENWRHLLKTISITVSTRAWKLNATEIASSYEYKMFKINNPSGNISTSIKEIYIYTNKFDTASRFQDFLRNAYDGGMIFAFPCVAITPTDTIINAQFFYDLNIDPSSYFVIFNDKSEYVAHQNLVVVESV